MPKKLGILRDIKIVLAILTIASTVLLISFGSPMAQLYEATLDRPGFLMTNVSLSSALASGESIEDDLLDPEALKVFYSARYDQPYWLSNFGISRRGNELLTVIDASWKHGLNPDSYHSSEIHTLAKRADPESQARLELLLTDAFVRYMRDLSGIRVNPHDFKLIDKNSWRKQKPAAELLALLNGEGRMGAMLTSAAPQGRTYKLLQDELVRLTQLGDEPWVGVVPIDFGGLMRPATRHKRIPDLRVRLGTGQQTHDPYYYDDALASAVIRFQSENGLKGDGIIGSNTLQALNRTRKEKIHQVIANLERLRWVDENRPEKFVVVNIPSYTLWAVERGQVKFEMPVVVGRSARPTQSFIAEISGVRFNPNWTVPPTIKRNDILPKIQEDPEYFTNKGIELIRGRGAERETLDPGAVDWENISWQELNAIEMVQIPGDHNPLGKIRILMPNEYNIYLHDTNHPEHFDNLTRAESSGCIRLKDPERMASFVMDGTRDWSDEKMTAMIDSRRMRDVAIENKIPVYVLYYTVWVDEQGRVVYGNDIYRQDGQLIKELERLDGFRIPGHNDNRMAGSVSTELVSVQ